MKTDKKRAEDQQAFVKHVVDDLKGIAEGEYRNDARHGFATDTRCRAERAGAALAGAYLIVELAHDLERAETEAAQLRDDLERVRKERQKLWSKANAPVRRPAPRKESPKPKKAATPAATPAAAPAPAAARAKPCREHKWDTTKTPPVCEVCGKVKSNRGRKSKANPAADVKVATVAGVTKVDPPSLPLPTEAKAKPKGITVELEDGRVVDLNGADEFEGGTVGARR
jgi:hypothetical protein